MHRKSSLIFDPTGTHVVVGGTGGLGRSILKSMMKNGARNIVSLSRSGGGKDEIEDLLRNAETSGVNFISLACDVGSLAQVERCVMNISQTLPPICGIIHAAMALRVSSFT